MSWSQDAVGFHTDSQDGHQQHGSDVSIARVDSRCELPAPNTCNTLSRSTDRAGGLLGGQRVDSDVMSGKDSTERLTTTTVLHLEGRQSSGEEVPHHEQSTSCEVTRDQPPSNDSAPPPSDQSGVDCHDWKFFADRRVGVPLLLDVLLSRKHRDRTAREFLLNLPASTLKKYEVFSRQHPLFVCLDIVKW